MKKINLRDESELQEILSSSLGGLEDDMSFIANEAQAYDQKSIDLLVQDKRGSLCVIELKHKLAERVVLGQILDYAHFVWNNYEILEKRYQDLKLSNDFDPDSNIRLIIIAEDFSDSLIRSLEFVDVEIELYQYKGFILHEEKNVICTPIKQMASPNISEDVEPTIQDHINYIINEEVRKILKDLLDFVKSISDQINIIPKKKHIACKIHSKNFLDIMRRRNIFIIDVYEEGKWSRYDISDDDPIDDEDKEMIINSFNFISQKMNH